MVADFDPASPGKAKLEVRAGSTPPTIISSPFQLRNNNMVDV